MNGLESMLLIEFVVDCELKHAHARSDLWHHHHMQQ